MSEHRHFLSRKWGHVESIEATDSNAVQHYGEDDRYVEVQVIPTDDTEWTPESAQRFVLTMLGYDESADAEDLLSEAETHLSQLAGAIAYLRKLPTVDQAQIDALNGLIVKAVGKGLVSVEGGIEFEEFLVRNGVRVEVKS